MLPSRHEACLAQTRGRASAPVEPDQVVEAGKVFAEPLELALGDAPPGEYRLSIGFYDQATGERLPLLATDWATPDANGQVLLPSVIQVQPEKIVYPEFVRPKDIAQTVELAYYAGLSSSPQGQPAVTRPVYLFDIYSPDGGYQMLVYVSAVD